MPRLSPRTPVRDMLFALEALPWAAWPVGWENWPNTRQAVQEAARQFRAGLTPPADPGRGRGVVTSGGGTKYFTSLYVMLCRLREVGCTLPVEVFHLGPREMDPHMVRLLTALGASVLDARALSLAFPWRILDGWELKPYAVLRSSFAEVLWLDADNSPTRDPSFLFGDPDYLRHGALFWPDYTTWTLPRAVWDAFGLEPRDDCKPLVPGDRVAETFGTPIPDGYDPPLESGQFLIDKRKRWKELRTAGWYAEHSDFTFRFVYGDKECFRLGWRACGTDYGVVRKFPGWQVHTELQHEPQTGEVLFLHRTQDKFRHDLRNTPAGLPGEERLFALAHQSAALWSGVPWVNRVPFPDEAELQARLVGKRFAYRRLGYDERVILLLADLQVGYGRADLERRWSVFIDHGRPVLAISGDVAVTCTAALGEDEVWRGAWLRNERMPVELEEERLPEPDVTVASPAPADVAHAGSGTPVRNEPPLAAPWLDYPSGPPRRHTLGVVMPAVLQQRTLLDMTCESLATVKGERFDGVRIYLVCNRLRNLDLDAEGLQRELAKHTGLPVAVLSGDRTVSGSWNAGIRAAHRDGCTRFLLMANDCFLLPGALDEMAEVEAVLPDDVDLVSACNKDGNREGDRARAYRDGCDFTCVMLRPETVLRHGWFDENYRPAYFEDNDYYARVVLAGRRAVTATCALIDHYGSATIKLDPEVQHHVNHWWGVTRAYFTSKWGVEDPLNDDGEILKRYHRHPFNDPNRPLSWWNGCPTKPGTEEPDHALDVPV